MLDGSTCKLKQYGERVARALLERNLRDRRLAAPAGDDAGTRLPCRRVQFV